MSLLFIHVYVCPQLNLVYGQCILNIRLHQFENVYNVVIRPEEAPNQICCCGQSSVVPCQSNLSAYFTTQCSPYQFCDTNFVATLSDCQISDPCPTILSTDVYYYSSTMTDVNYVFQIDLSAFPSESVRVLLMCV